MGKIYYMFDEISNTMYLFVLKTKRIYYVVSL